MKLINWKTIFIILILGSLSSCSQTEKEEEGFNYYEISFFGKVGVKDYYSGETIVPAKFDSVIYWWQSSGKKYGLEPMRWFIAYKRGLAELYNINGDVIIERDKYVTILPLLSFRTKQYVSLCYLVRSTNGGVGLCDSSGYEIVSCVYDKVYVKLLPKYEFGYIPQYDCYKLTTESDEDGGFVVDEELILATIGNYIEVYDKKGKRIVDDDREYVDIDFIGWTSQYFIVGKQQSGRIEILTSKGNVLFGDFADNIELEYTGSRLPYFVSHRKEGDRTKRVYDIKGNFLFEVSAINDKNVEIFYDDDKGFGYEYWSYDDYDWLKTYVGKRIRYWE